jgi:hypothetical protein
VSRVAGVAVIMALLAVAACSGGSNGTARSNGPGVGIAEGAAEVLADGADVAVDLTARDPFRAGCRLRIRP